MNWMANQGISLPSVFAEWELSSDYFTVRFSVEEPSDCFRAEVMEDGDEKYEKARAFGAKYFPTDAELEHELSHSYDRADIVRIRIDHMTGKQVKEK